MDFARKYRILEPFFAINFSAVAVADPWKINDLRNDLFHGRAIKEAKFKGKSICEESTVQEIFIAAQSASRNLDKLNEMLDAPHALADRWRERLEQLNEPIL
jgi:hypothetical protein